MTSGRKAKSVLVANRGEIAVRIFRTARRIGFRCVAVYSDADADAGFVRAADTAVRIGPAPASESYLRPELIVQAALDTGAGIVHPGYGFLSEDPRLAQACADAGLEFAGPSAGVLATLGNKMQAKQVAQAAGVPVLDGYAGADQSDDALVSGADAVGYPLTVKPAAGGGGKGMAVVRSRDELVDALTPARRIAATAFGDDRLLLERYVPHARHIEVQIFGDHAGHVIHLYERDCSVQRRHQKVVEQAPAPQLDDELRDELCSSAVALARHVGYVGAGTCEFLVGRDGTFGFIEVNARLQVEHPVTEAVCGVDLVELQLRVASGEPLGMSQDDIRLSGHAIEARVYAEDPDEGFLPQAGRLLHLRWPSGVRVDAGVEEGDRVTTHYDPLLAKVVVHEQSAASALESLRRALDATQVLGVRTNIGLLRTVACHDDVAAGTVTTTWLEDVAAPSRPDRVAGEAAALAAAAQAESHFAGRRGPDPWATFGPWTLTGPAPVAVSLGAGDAEAATYQVVGDGPYRIGPHTAERAVGCHAWRLDGVEAAVAHDAGVWYVWWEGMQHELPVEMVRRRPEQVGVARLQAPMPGTVAAVRVAAGDAVGAGQELVVVEAMKMEHPVVAPADGTVRAVLCRPGDQVDRGQALVDFESGP